MAQALATKAGWTALQSGEYPFGGWREYTPSGIYIDVETYMDFDEPVYVASLLGNAWHWLTTGGSSVYPTPGRAMRDGFRVYVRFFDGRPLDPQFAANQGWRVSWIGMRYGVLFAQ